MHPLLADPWVAEKIEAALKKYGSRLTEKQKVAFREKMAWTFANHPAAQRILSREHPAQVEGSGTRLKGSASDSVDVGDAGTIGVDDVGTGIRQKKGARG